MKRRAWIVAGAFGFAIGGCSVAGSWKTDTIEPPGVPFPVEMLTLSPDSQYTASWQENGRRRTSTGQYRWTGSELEIIEGGRTARTYQGKLRLDGRLVLTYGEGNAKVVAILEKSKD